MVSSPGESPRQLEDHKAVVVTHASVAAIEQPGDARTPIHRSNAVPVRPLFDHGSWPITHEPPSKSSAGSIGAAVAGAIGGTFGLVAGVAVLAVPGLGSLIASGTIRAVLAGLGIGGVVGWLVARRSRPIGRPNPAALHVRSKQRRS